MRELIRSRLGRAEAGAAKEAPAPARRGDHDLDPGVPRRQRMIPAAVLVPLIDRPGGVSVLLTRRAEELEVHPGQISFPGGRAQGEDGGPVETALREAGEEIGLARRHVEIVGRLDLYETVTGFLITPVVGLISPGFSITLDESEVAEIFEVPLDFVLDPANHGRDSRLYQGVERHYYVLAYKDRYIWGATAGILVNLYNKLVRSC